MDIYTLLAAGLLFSENPLSKCKLIQRIALQQNRMEEVNFLYQNQNIRPTSLGDSKMRKTSSNFRKSIRKPNCENIQRNWKQADWTAKTQFQIQF